MTVRTPPTPRQDPQPAPHADVIKDARARQRRHRRAGGVLLLVTAGAAIGAVVAGGGGGSTHANGLGRTGSGALSQAVTPQLPRGRSSARFAIHAPAARAYRVTVSAPTGARLVLRMRINESSGWSLDLPRSRNCIRTSAGSRCTLNFAEGGNPGGTWSGTLRKLTLPEALVHIDVAFASRAGDVQG